jgi:hypothetical protein
MDYIEKVNQTKVTPDLLIEANLAVSDLESHDRSDFTARSIELLKIVDRMGLSVEKSSDVMTAISFRLEALARLEFEKHKEMGAWSMPGDVSGMVFAHADLFKVAACEPLVNVEEKAVFNAENFFKRLLAISKAHGHA